MIINSGTYTMESERKFQKKHSINHSITTGLPEENSQGEILDFAESQKKEKSALTPAKGNFLSTLAYNKYGRYSYDETSNIGSTSTVDKDNSDIAAEETNTRVQFSALSYLFRIFFGDSQKLNLQNALWATAQSGSYKTFQYNETYEENEVTSFNTTGTVLTSDGREINFNLNVGMSRSFYTETNATMICKNHPMLDPLVINLDDDPDSISDQTFFFDLDCDGTLDEISSLKKGSGFLALDKNGDGEINNGGELFGASSGDGFSELAAYDLDGNGWIDEADDIYDKLRVWSVDSDGNPKLFSLKESDIGAICLASAPTRFSVTDEWNQTRAMVRSSGFFLRESTGMAGSVQQIDLAAM